MKKKLPIKEAKDGTIQKLKNRIRRLEKENERLRHEVNTLESFRELTTKHLDDKLDGIPIERVIKGVQKKHKLKDISDNKIKEVCPKCISSELKEVPYPGGKVRTCSNCDFRDTVKEK